MSLEFLGVLEVLRFHVFRILPNFQEFQAFWSEVSIATKIRFLNKNSNLNMFS